MGTNDSMNANTKKNTSTNTNTNTNTDMKANKNQIMATAHSGGSQGTGAMDQGREESQE
jgi:hypothetical protein